MADAVIEEKCQPVDKVDGCVSSKEKETKEEDKQEEPKEKKVPENGHSTNGTNNEEDKETDENAESEPELYFTPKVSLPLVDVKSMEEQEEVMVELRSRIYRYDTSEDDEPEFKERGTGLVKILRHNENNMYRILLRRDKTHKICANHYITSSMVLAKHNNSDKVFVYNTLADLYEGETSPETFAIRFSSPENATIFKNAFDDAVKNIKQSEKEEQKNSEVNSDVNDLTENLKNVELEPEKKPEETETDPKKAEEK